MLQDEGGYFSDWVEIRNPDAVEASLAGYFLTDDAEILTKWPIPAVTLAPRSSVIIFASNKNRTDPASELHTNFRLAV